MRAQRTPWLFGAFVFALLLLISLLNIFLDSTQVIESFVSKIYKQPPQGATQADNTTTTTDTRLPAALLPVASFTGCCGAGANQYEQTCLTEAACVNNSLYPFTSRQEQFMLKWRTFINKQNKMRHHKACQQANHKLHPNFTWCNATQRFPMGCSHYSMGGRSGPYDRVLLFPSNKLAYCGIPKAGISPWLQFLRFTRGAKDYQSIPYFKKDVNPFILDRLMPRVQKRVWIDPTTRWFRAVLVRNPAERLLSCYLDKIATHKRKTNATIRIPPYGWNVTFAQFVEILSESNVTKYPHGDNFSYTGLSWFADSHWRPQAYACGLYNDLESFDYVGTLDKAALHSRQILERVGLWESFGQYYRVSSKSSIKGHPFAIYPPLINDTTSSVGFQQDGVNENDQHNRNSSSLIQQYYTPELLEKVKRLYWMDFELYNAIQQAESRGMTHGRDVARILNPKCRYD